MIKYIILNDAKRSLIKYEKVNGLLNNALVYNNGEWVDSIEFTKIMTKVINDNLEDVVGKSLDQNEVIEETLKRKNVCQNEMCK